MSVIAKKTLAVLLLLVTGWYLIDFPYGQILLLIGLSAYFIIFQFYPCSWLIVIPTLLPLLYLTPLTGRLFFDEFDLFLLVTLAAYLWKNKQLLKSNQLIPLSGKLILMLFCIFYFIAMLRGLLPLNEINFNSYANYYSHLNSLRISKGFFWALCMLPVWKYSKTLYPNKTERFFSFGMLLGSIGVFIVMLWERGVLVDIFYAKDKYSLLSSFLDFGTQYRATGLFSEMHVGDSATDGYVALALPLVGYFLATSRNKYQLILGILAVLGVMYSMVVTFSRGVYLGAISILLFLPYLQHLTSKEKIKPLSALLTIAAAVIFFMLCLMLFRHGGMLSLLGGLVLFMSGLTALDLYKKLPTFLCVSIIGITVTFCAYAIVHGILSSKWSQTEHIAALTIALLALVGLLGVGLLMYKVWENHSSVWKRMVTASVVCAISGILILSLFGSRMEDRFSTVATDFQGRVAHWKNAVNIMDADLSTSLLGQGIGRFPETYYWNTQQAKNVDVFIFKQEDKNTYMTFSGSYSLNLSQRIDIQPNTTYYLSVDVRTSSNATLVMKICHRQIIVPYEWNPTCWIKSEVINTHGNWDTVKFIVPSGKLGSIKYYLQAPLLLTFTNSQYPTEGVKQTLLDIDNIALKTESNQNLIKNGDFEQGIERWYGFYDFNHLPWHIKNLWVNAYFEMGLLGLISFILLTAYSIKNAYSGSRLRNYFSAACLLCIIGFQCVGAFGTILDAPRVAFLYYLLLLISLQTEKPVNPYLR